MRHGQTTILKRIALPFSVLLALVLPVGAGAAVKLEADDAAVRIPTAIFGTHTAPGSMSHAFVDDHDDKGKDKEKKCKEKKEDCDEPTAGAAAVEPPAAPEEEKSPADEIPEASWSS